MTRSAAKALRCAIYTRVSTDHGLEQEFNSLDAQREAAEAYIKSQSHEGWRLMPDAYDDGGFSGGSLERPALKRLLGDVAAGRIDIIVVYKVDRLTRSLADFARLVDLFDRHSVSFVSVTQAFNTTSSMGRLTLNVLLSFAQFEREVTGERIRDKIAASKQKGLWMGGVLPLGYRVEHRKLVIDLDEADIVRSMFKQYLQLGSLSALQQALRDQGVRTRIRTLSNGKRVGGVPLNNGALSLILRNRTYLGDINHRGQSYPGEHEPIIASEVFEAVQALIARNLVEKGAQRRGTQALLMAKLRDDHGHAMSPSYAVKNGARYRYYVSQALMQGRKAEAGSLSRVAADAIEREVVKQLRSLDSATGIGTEPSAADPEPLQHADHCIDAVLIQRLVDHVVVSKTEVTIHLNTDGRAADQLPSVTFAWTPPSPTRQRQIIPVADAGDRLAQTPMTAQTRSKLVRSIAQARLWLDQLTRDPTATAETIAKREGFNERAVRMKLSLAFLAPDIVEAAIAGRLPQSFGVTRLTDLPMDWTAQRRALGIAQHAH